MRIETLAHAGEAVEADFSGKSVLIIDVFRATSCMVTGLACGCAGFLPVLTLEEARAAAGSGDLLAGERKGKRPDGFHLGNSPLDYLAAGVTGKRIILTTSNGTRAIHYAHRTARTIMAGSLLNASAAAGALLALERDVYLICSGTHNRFSLEDGLCAGFITDELLELAGQPLVLGDLTQAMLANWRQVRNRLPEVLAGSTNGKRLTGMGYGRDVEFCGTPDRYHLVPVWHNGLLVPLPEADPLQSS
ncbi:MAG: 2-phosphosulfolactate phosphatase [Paenibacillaceae bacterium]|jgi:2-phosphosulfolactate phosphatase|nr:2-phosphosulfolactate phosphatase [Paenibacillaceae bacterium]